MKSESSPPRKPPLIAAIEVPIGTVALRRTRAVEFNQRWSEEHPESHFTDQLGKYLKALEVAQSTWQTLDWNEPKTLERYFAAVSEMELAQGMMQTWLKCGAAPQIVPPNGQTPAQWIAELMTKIGQTRYLCAVMKGYRPAEPDLTGDNLTNAPGAAQSFAGSLPRTYRKLRVFGQLPSRGEKLGMGENQSARGRK